MIDTKTARNDMINRDTILMMSNDELSSVCTAEAAAQLPPGAIFLDLEHLDRGIQEARKGGVEMGGVLPRAAVRDKTWKKIEAVLARFAQATPTR